MGRYWSATWFCIQFYPTFQSSSIRYKWISQLHSAIFCTAPSPILKNDSLMRDHLTIEIWQCLTQKHSAGKICILLVKHSICLCLCFSFSIQNFTNWFSRYWRLCPTIDTSWPRVGQAGWLHARWSSTYVVRCRLCLWNLSRHLAWSVKVMVAGGSCLHAKVCCIHRLCVSESTLHSSAAAQWVRSHVTPLSRKPVAIIDNTKSEE